MSYHWAVRLFFTFPTGLRLGATWPPAATLGLQDWRQTTYCYCCGLPSPPGWCIAAALCDWPDLVCCKTETDPYTVVTCVYIISLRLRIPSLTKMSCFHLRIATFLFTWVPPAITLFTELEHLALSRVNMQHI